MAIAKYTIGMDYGRRIIISRYRGMEKEIIYNGSRINEALSELKARMKRDLGER